MDVDLVEAVARQSRRRLSARDPGTPGAEAFQRLGGGQAPRLLTDLVGPYYTLVFEHSYPSLAEYERSSREGMANEEWRAWYPKVAALAGGGHREIFNRN